MSSAWANRVYPICRTSRRGQTVGMGERQAVGGTRSFLPAVEGMRACAALGVVITHVAFETGHSAGVDGRLFGRFDLAVAVFFALSGFLLWRSHAAAARGLAPRPATGHYLRSRVVRIMPAYLVAVVVILTLLPDGNHASPTVWLANLTLTQVYVPLTLTAGLTQMWSLSVEVSFYLALPILAMLAARLPVRGRVPAIASLAVASLVVGLDSVRCAARVESVDLAAGLLLLVRRGHAARRVGAQPVRLAAPVGATPGADGRRRGGGVSGGRLAAGRAARVGAQQRRTVHGEDRDGCAGGGGSGGAAGVGPARRQPSAVGQRPDGDAGTLVLRNLHLASCRDDDGVPGDRPVLVPRTPGRSAGADADLQHRHRRGELCARRITMPGSVAALGETRGSTARSRLASSRADAVSRRQEDAIAP